MNSTEERTNPTDQQENQSFFQAMKEGLRRWRNRGTGASSDSATVTSEHSEIHPQLSYDLLVAAQANIAGERDLGELGLILYDPVDRVINPKQFAQLNTEERAELIKTVKENTLDRMGALQDEIINTLRSRITSAQTTGELYRNFNAPPTFQASPESIQALCERYLKGVTQSELGPALLEKMAANLALLFRSKVEELTSTTNI